MDGAEQLSRGIVRVLGLALMMAVHAWLAFDTLTKSSPTCDETAHLAAAETYAAFGDFRMYPQNPPLPRLLAAAASQLPVSSVPASWNSWPADRWAYGYDIQAGHDRDDDSRRRYLREFNRARLVGVAWSALTIPVVFWWGQWWFGTWSAWLSAFLYTFCPHMIAYAGLVTTDLPATASIFMAAFAFARWLDGPSLVRALAAGGLLGIALLCKFSAVGFALLLPLWAALHPALRGGGPERVAQRLNPFNLFTTAVGRQFCLLAFAAWFALNMGYRWQGRLALKRGENPPGYAFAGWFTTLGEFPFVSKSLTRGPRDLERFPLLDAEKSLLPEGHPDDRGGLLGSRVNRFRGGALGWLPTPLPYMYVVGFDDQMMEAEGGYQQYFRGELRRKGWREYYLYAVILKTPLGTLILAALGFLGAFWFRDLAPGKYFTILVLALWPMATMTFGTDICLGLRYVLPMFPFLCLLGGAFVRHGRPPSWMILALPLAGWTALGTLRTHPHELAYFNALAGRPENYSAWLIDSNLDWGQGLRPLAQWIKKNPEWADARVAFWGSVPPRFEAAFCGLEQRWDPLPPPRNHRTLWSSEIERPETWPAWPSERDDDFGPLPGKHIVSANYLRGHQHPLATPEPWLPNPALPREAWPPHLSRSLGSIRMTNAPAGCFTWFQHFTPRVEAQVGPSLLFFDIGIEEANAVRDKLKLPLLSVTPRNSESRPAP